MQVDISPLRVNFVRFFDELQKLSHALLDGEPMMRGTVYEMKRKCGGAHCVCVTEGKLHATLVISWSEEGKTRLKTLSNLDVEDYRRMSRRYKEFRKVRRRVDKVFQEMIQLIDRVEIKRRKEP